jgi:hypothetical protein
MLLLPNTQWGAQPSLLGGYEKVSTKFYSKDRKFSRSEDMEYEGGAQAAKSGPGIGS